LWSIQCLGFEAKSMLRAQQDPLHDEVGKMAVETFRREWIDPDRRGWIGY
jgi:hypothetical protein